MSDTPKYIFTHKVGDVIKGSKSNTPYQIIEDLGGKMLLKSLDNGVEVIAAKILHANTFVMRIP